ncbi:PucR family transcriptional regulator [Alloscardovia criceti]|uniref:PucR family transcriptional regulator n=1 Tax=Alloscardovia criceti TaxID=356828 RepID=UPI0003A6F851|nr:helix-turn-helix domain-containing protein [Alloscardovia criceti]
MAGSVQFYELDPQSRQSVELIVNESLKVCKEKTDWYANLGTKEAEYLRVILLTAVSDYVIFAREHAADGSHPDSISADNLFNLAPLETTFEITLDNVIEAIRIVVDTAEKRIDIFAPAGQEAAYVRAALYFSREVAFSAARIYGRVAATRSIWDTRDEAFIIESLLNQDYSASLQSRVASFKWKSNELFFAIVGSIDTSKSLHSGFIQADLRNAVLQLGGQLCVSSHEKYTIMLIGMGHQTSRQPFLELMSQFFEVIPEVCAGPKRSRLEGASQTLRAAMNGFNARAAYPNHPNLLSSDDLLAERALLGDAEAQDELYTNVYMPMKNDERKTQILTTLRNYLFSGSSLEKTAQLLNVHPNTVRYRLKKSIQLTGWDATNPREAYVLTTAIKIGLYRDSQGENAE